MRARFVRTAVLLCLSWPILPTANDTPKHAAQPTPTVNSQAVPSKPAATFTKTTELVQIDVIVTGHKGEHVRGLKKQDFTLLEDGQPRDLAVFEEIETGKRPVKRAAPAKGEYTNEIAASRRANRLTIILLDALNTPDFADFAWARGKLWKYLATVAQSGEPVAIYVMDGRGIHIIHDFTTDMSTLAAALKVVKPSLADATKPPGDGVSAANADAAYNDTPLHINTGRGSGAIFQQEVRRLTVLRDQMFKDRAEWEACANLGTTHSALRMLAQAYAGIPGRKAMLWVSDLAPISPPELPTKGPHDSIGACGTADKLETTWKALADAQMVVYPLSAEGLPVSGFLDSWEYRWGPMSDLARATGGKAFYGRNDLDVGFAEAAQDSTQYYLLGYYLKGGERPGWRKLQVKVRDAKLQVRSRSGFYVAPPVTDPEKALEQAFAFAASAPLDFTGIVFRLRPSTVRWLPSLKRVVRLSAKLPSGAFTVDDTDGNHLLLDFGIIAITPKGDRPVHVARRLESRMSPASLAKVRAGGLTYNAEIELYPGEYTLRLIVRDALSGRMGSVSAPYTVE